MGLKCCNFGCENKPVLQDADDCFWCVPCAEREVNKLTIDIEQDNLRRAELKHLLNDYDTGGLATSDRPNPRESTL